MPPAGKFPRHRSKGEEPIPPRPPDFAGKASRETRGSGRGKYWKDPRPAGGGDVGFSYLGDAEQKEELGSPSLRRRRGRRPRAGVRRSPRPAPEPAAQPRPPLPRSRASCHGDQTCLCALRCCDFLILLPLARAHSHSRPHAHATPT